MGVKKAKPQKQLIEDDNQVDSEIYSDGATTIFDDSALDYNEHFFRKYYLSHSEGKSYIFEVDGMPVLVNKIVEVRSDLLIVQSTNEQGQVMTIRIPYNSIENFSES